MLLPDHEVLATASEVCPATFLDQAEDVAALASVEMEIESATSERSSHDYKTYLKHIIEVVTRAVARLKLDWPQEQETPKQSKIDDRFLSRGQGEGPQ